MESTSISDVRRMCQRGAFRAYVQGGKVFLEDGHKRNAWKGRAKTATPMSGGAT